MLKGAQSHEVAAAIFDDCFHLLTKFVRKSVRIQPHELNYVVDELARLAKGLI
jgi:hypothetical protein